MNLALAMDLAALCDMCRWKWYQLMPLAGFSEDLEFDRHFVATHPPPPSHPIGLLLVFITPVNNYLKWREIQLAIHPIASWWIDS